MLNRILAFSLRNRGLVFALALLVAIGGTLRALSTPIDVLPDLDRPTVTVLTEAPGFVAEDVERLVTWPIEQAVTGATGVRRVRSSSQSGLSIVICEFDWGTDLFVDRQIVSEKLQLAGHDLPAEVTPLLAPISSIVGQIQIVGFRSRDGSTTPLELRRIVERDVRPRVLSLGGVAQALVIGGEATELRVEVRPEDLVLHGVTLEEVDAAIQSGDVQSNAGLLELGAKGPRVAVSGRAREAIDLERAVLRDDPDRPLLLGDVATVSLGARIQRTGEAGIDGAPGVQMIVSKQPGADTLALARKLETELEALGSTLPPDVEVIDDLFRQATFIERAVENVVIAVRDGALLVVLVLFAFLLNLRTTLITLTAIPLSLAATALCFAAFDMTINTMTLGGLAVAIGTLVDDAIVDVENVHRRLFENACSAKPRSRLSVVFLACSEVRKPVLYGTLLVTVVYLPLFFLQGVEGRLFRPVGLAYVISVLASLGVALTVTPVLASWLLRGGGPGKGTPGDPGELVPGGASGSKEYGGALVRFLQGLAGRAISSSLARPWHWIGGLAAACLCAFVLMADLGRSFLPEFDEGSAQINIVLPSDVSLTTSDQFGSRLERAVAGVPGVTHVARRTGRAEGDEHAMGVNITEAILSFDAEDAGERAEVLAEIRERLAAELPGVKTSVEQPLAHLLSHLLSGVYAQVAVVITGPDMSVLHGASTQVEALLKDIPGVVDLYAEPAVLVDEVEVLPRRERLLQRGLTVEAVARTVELALGSSPSTEVLDGRLRNPVVVRLAGAQGRNPERIGDLLLRDGEGGLLRLSEVADLRVVQRPSNVQHQDGERRVIVQHNVQGRSLSEVVADVERALGPVRARLAEHAGYGLRLAGQFEAQRAADRVLLLLGGVALVAMGMLLHIHFRSAVLALLVLSSVPMAFIGAGFLVWGTGQELSVATLVGFIALFGIASRNSILLFDHYVHRMAHEGDSFSPGMILRAGQERMVPVVMTALTSGIALLPLFLEPDKPGREILYPVATVLLGGLVTSTLLDFFVTPGLFWLFGRGPAERLVRIRSRSDQESEELARGLEEASVS